MIGFRFALRYIIYVIEKNKKLIMLIIVKLITLNKDVLRKINRGIHNVSVLLKKQLFFNMLFYIVL